MKRVLIFVAVISVYLVFFSTVLKQFIADIYYESSMSYLNKAEYETALKHIELATGANPNEPAYYRGKAKILAAVSMVGTTTASSQNTKEEALSSLKKAEVLNPHNLATLRNSVPLYYYLSLKKVDENGSVSVDEVYSGYAKTFYAHLKDTYKNDLGIIADVAQYERKLDFDEEYSQSFENAKKLRPEVVEWHSSFIDQL